MIFIKKKIILGLNEIYGEIKNSKGVLQYEIEGKLTEYFKLKPVNKKGEDQVLWRKNRAIEHSLEQYGYTNFTLQLNYLNQSLLQSILPTDSRFRTDVRALEIGDFEIASHEKKIIRENNLKIIDKKTQSGQPLTPRWFKEEMDPVTKTKIFIYQNNFLEERDASTKNYDDFLWF